MRGPNPRDIRERFGSKISRTESCWLWRGTLHANGYGLFDLRSVEGRWRKHWAHRIAYEIFTGRQLQTGDTIDHLCAETRCVNPDHLEAVPIGENSRRSPRTLTGANARKTHCPRGHPYSGANLFYDQGKRRCRECVRAKNRRAHARRRASRP